MPAIGWQTLANRLMDQAFNPAGKHRRAKMGREGVPATRSALSTVMNAVARQQVHPGVTGQHIQGAHGDVFLVWPTGGRNVLFPVPGVGPVIMRPITHNQTFANGDQPFQMEITSWIPNVIGSIDVPGAFLDPAAHWEFIDVIDDDQAAG